MTLVYSHCAEKDRSPVSLVALHVKNNKHCQANMAGSKGSPCLIHLQRLSQCKICDSMISKAVAAVIPRGGRRLYERLGQLVRAAVCIQHYVHCALHIHSIMQSIAIHHKVLHFHVSHWIAKCKCTGLQFVATVEVSAGFPITLLTGLLIYEPSVHSW